MHLIEFRNKIFIALYLIFTISLIYFNMIGLLYFLLSLEDFYRFEYNHFSTNQFWMNHSPLIYVVDYSINISFGIFILQIFFGYFLFRKKILSSYFYYAITLGCVMQYLPMLICLYSFKQYFSPGRCMITSLFLLVKENIYCLGLCLSSIVLIMFMVLKIWDNRHNMKRNIGSRTDN